LIEIGIDHYAASKTGQIEFVRLMKEQTRVSKGHTIGTYESGKWIGQIKSSVSGIIKEKNTRLRENPELLNNDPYGLGWILRIEGTNIDEELKNNPKIVPVGEELEKHINWRISREKS
ncbi:MAG: glycine cleavage system protein H, partial [Candidatus Heimdallarchaeaceae archaeon]